MNFQQLEYVVALDEHRHFRKAAEHCQVTQPTLSMMVKKLEEELGASFFDRNKKPIVPTEVGREVIKKARKAIRQFQEIPEIVQQHQGQVIGKLRLGIVTTMAPYLLPLFVQPLLKKYPNVELEVKEMIAGQIVEALKVGQIDVGLMVTPLNNKALVETPVFYEKLYAYVADSEPLYEKEHISPGDIDMDQLWLLEEGHCLRNQVMNLFGREKSHLNKSLKYEAGSIETAKKFVDHNGGMTILPELAVHEMDGLNHQLLRPFKDPEPIREVSLVTHRTFIKKRLVQVLRKEILAVIPSGISQHQPKGRILDNS